MRKLYLENFPELFSETLDADFCSTIAKCTALALSDAGHKSGVVLKGAKIDQNMFKGEISILWKYEMTNRLRNVFQDVNRKTEFAAVCLGLSMMKKILGYRYAFSSRTGTGIDFWLSNEKNLDFNQCVRLEISGIFKATASNSIKKRLSEKRTQVEKSDHLKISAYIAIIECSQPKAAFNKK